MRQKIGYAVLMMAFCSHAETIHKCERDGHTIYQNWPCGQKAPEKPSNRGTPDYPAIVKCSMLESAENVIKGMVSDRKPIRNCTP